MKTKTRPHKAALDQLTKALTYWFQNQPLLATRQQTERVARRFAVHPKLLQTALRLYRENQP